MSGPTIDEAITTAERGSQVEAAHTTANEPESEQDRITEIQDVEGATEGRVAAGQPVPDGPPFDSEVDEPKER